MLEIYFWMCVSIIFGMLCIGINIYSIEIVYFEYEYAKKDRNFLKIENDESNINLTYLRTLVAALICNIGIIVILTYIVFGKYFQH